METTLDKAQRSENMHYLPLTEEDKRKMLEEIGVSSFEDLLKGIPAALRDPELRIGEALSEFDIQNLMKTLGKKNKSAADVLSFLGGGSYEHFIPTAVGEIMRRNEFYTAYTPYQPEAAQGSLQVIFEYQSLITELTGLDVTNASHYDGSTSLAEAAVLALRQTDRTKILVSRAVHPHYRQVLKTYFHETPYKVVEFGFGEDKTFDRADFESKIADDTAGAIFQTPNFFGVLEDLEGVSDKLHTNGSLLLLTANPMSMGSLRSPGEWGADVAAGEGQPLGVPLQYGGPYLGYFSVSRALMRRIPGRLAGMTQDSQGRRAYCLTLQAREQHIRRERAASNICTNQALCALAACVYMTLLGKEGIQEVAELNMDRAAYLRRLVADVPGFEVRKDQPIFNEFVVKSKVPFKMIEEKLIEKNILPGIDLSQFYPELKNEFLVCATETKTREQLENFVKELGKC
ncbi:MAG TPA: aminomethyl-transferring glycine dehydrogenase subunit GcvPA [Verrucomicrobiae bacterium]|jgi:glycine dehydrogenase subunit 1|nr:aminomethyl-transferring glycine dehydrogenase subunit GcvPA [Verrucomicrobiae bacterium]